MAADRVLDLSRAEEECGNSALQVVQRELKGLEVGQVLEIHTTVAEQAFAVRAWARKTDTVLLEDRTEGTRTCILLKRLVDS
jgi:TusA-related sulfurtransferase